MLLTAFIAVPDVAIDRYVPLDSELLKIGDESICFFLRQNACKRWHSITAVLNSLAYVFLGSGFAIAQFFTLEYPLEGWTRLPFPGFDAVTSAALLKDLLAPGILGV